MENDLFRTTRGFMTALNGIYIDLLNSSLYGKTLTWGMSDILAQYYTCREKDHASKSLADFDNEARNNAVSGCWSRSYALLNNINTVLEHCESDRGVLDDTYYHWHYERCYISSYSGYSDPVIAKTRKKSVSLMP